jgi:hypothetical protein
MRRAGFVRKMVLLVFLVVSLLSVTGAGPAAAADTIKIGHVCAVLPDGRECSALPSGMPCKPWWRI